MKMEDSLKQVLINLGCKKHFILYREIGCGRPEHERAILVKVRHPAEIIEGRLIGSMIDLYNQTTFRVWTPKVRKAQYYAKQYGLTLRLLDGECELFIPVTLADTLLQVFGARVKKTPTKAQLACLKAHSFKSNCDKPGGQPHNSTNM